MIKRAKRTCDKTVVVLMALLLIMGLITLFSATYYPRRAMRSRRSRSSSLAWRSVLRRAWFSRACRIAFSGVPR